MGQSKVHRAPVTGREGERFMPDPRPASTGAHARVIEAVGEAAEFSHGDAVTILTLCPIGHFRVPNYVRGRSGRVESVLEPRAINNEEEGFGRNAGMRRHYYRVAIPLARLWSDYAGPAHDSLRIEVFEAWLERT
jgi:hypothetical protein